MTPEILYMPNISSVCFGLDSVWDPNVRHGASEPPGRRHREGLRLTQYDIEEMLCKL